MIITPCRVSNFVLNIKLLLHLVFLIFLSCPLHLPHWLAWANFGLREIFSFSFSVLLYYFNLLLVNCFMCSKLLLSTCKIKKAIDDNDCCSFQFKSHYPFVFQCNKCFIYWFIPFFFRMQDVIYRLSKVSYCVTLMFTKFTLKTNKALTIFHKFLVPIIIPKQVQ